jgi:hypothetical protein
MPLLQQNPTRFSSRRFGIDLGQTGAMFCTRFGTTIPFDEATQDSDVGR